MDSSFIRAQMKLWTFTLILTLCAVAVSTHSKIRQKRTWIIDSFTIEEEGQGPFPYLLGTIHVDKKYLVNFALSGSGVDTDPKGVLSINSNTGEIYVHKKVDYEVHPVLRLKFEAKNVSNDQVDTRLGVEVKIQDINDNPPLFSPLNSETTINESLSQGQSVLTILAADIDDGNTPNGTFNFKLVSATPKTDNVEFYIQQHGSVGKIYFKGCLDYEKAQKYTLLIEAKDNGEKIQLSSTTTVVVNIIDGNNHLPEISGHTGPKKVKEREIGVEVLRLQVTDKDTRGSPAWRAKFTLHGDEEKYFEIRTDPATNEGILSVVKAMDYEEQSSRNISVSVENETPYFYCKVKNSNTKGLWDVESSAGGSGTNAAKTKLHPLTISVEDINDPPEFVPPIKEIMIMENPKIGTILETLTAQDPDKSFESSFRFLKGEDKDNWVTVDPKTGQISVAKVMDRESAFVKNSTYNVTVYVVDNAQPPLTGTGTVVIHLGDQNDNIPLLTKTSQAVYVCSTDNETMTNITAEDLDLPPYSGPFHYELLGDVKGKWKIEPNPGTTVNLVRDKNVYSGHYELQIKISDNQGIGSVQNLTVTVCDCIVTPSCHVQRTTAAKPSFSAIGIILFALFLLLAFLLMALLLSCKAKKTMIPTDEAPDWYLINSNIETPGTDCKMPPKIIHTDPSKSMVKTSDYHRVSNAIRPQEISASHNGFASSAEQSLIRRSLRRSSTRRSYRQVNNYNMMQSMSKNYSIYDSDDLHMRQALLIQLDQRLLQLQKPQEELGDYNPRCYADEGEFETSRILDNISIPETEFDPDILTHLDFQFNKLAAVCQPDRMV